ncbi:uncharacterized protein LOC126750145 [Anthonomus grandis grandis]|uniref:uncharacterized protein LOC126750145 n=1 Tax=Anthonomus grandis grandis TaxID=2921223 RepID=UPI0021668821|nr:uncharacterized protein LOC126750145 [Anthonomus grandis grandis]
MHAFMKETKEKRPTQSNMISQPIRQSEENTKNELESEPGTSKETSNATSQTTTTSVVSEVRNLKTASQKAIARSSLAASKRRYQDLSTAVSELRDINCSLLQSGNEEDEFEAFGRYMAIALKKLPLHLALQCQNELQTTLTRYRCMSLTPSPFTSLNLPSPTGSSHSSGKTYWGSNYSTQPPLQSPQSPGYQLPSTPAPSSEQRSPLSSPVQQPPLLSPTIYYLPPAPLDQQQQSFSAPGYQLLQSTSEQNHGKYPYLSGFGPRIAQDVRLSVRQFKIHRG